MIVGPCAVFWAKQRGKEIFSYNQNHKITQADNWENLENQACADFDCKYDVEIRPVFLCVPH